MANEQNNWPVEIIRSARRRKTVSAELKNGVLVIRAPAAMDDAELAHLEQANHGPRFWRLVNKYPLTERARGYLMAVGLEEIED
jgi:predicted metal-dependent hydrolase